jgi:hypothetical protein
MSYAEGGFGGAGPLVATGNGEGVGAGGGGVVVGGGRRLGGSGTVTVQLAAVCADPPPLVARTTSVCAAAERPARVRGLTHTAAVAPSRLQVTDVALAVVNATFALVSVVEPDGALVNTTLGAATIVQDADAVAVRPE